MFLPLNNIQMSTKFSLSSYDWKSWLINIIIFFAPVLWYISFQLSTLAPIDWRYVYLVGAGLVLNLFKKWLADHNVPVSTPNG